MTEQKLEPNRLAEAIGQFYSFESVSEMLGKNQVELMDAIYAYDVIGCESADGYWCFPTWQFDDDNSVNYAIRDVAKILHTGTNDGWTIALWISSKLPVNKEDLEEFLIYGDDTSLEGVYLSPIHKLLRDGKHIDQIKMLATNDATVWSR